MRRPVLLKSVARPGEVESISWIGAVSLLAIQIGTVAMFVSFCLGWFAWFELRGDPSVDPGDPRGLLQRLAVGESGAWAGLAITTATGAVIALVGLVASVLLLRGRTVRGPLATTVLGALFGHFLSYGVLFVLIIVFLVSISVIAAVADAWGDTSVPMRLLIGSIISGNMLLAIGLTAGTGALCWRWAAALLRGGRPAVPTG